MKICLSKDGIKRNIETPFAMAIQRDDLVRLGEHLIGLAAAMEAKGTSYSFVTIDPDGLDHGPPNTPPLEWTDIGDRYR